jgi:hypothetical protein
LYGVSDAVGESGSPRQRCVCWCHGWVSDAPGWMTWKRILSPT